jgi:hypothetical protein
MVPVSALDQILTSILTPILNYLHQSTLGPCDGLCTARSAFADDDNDDELTFTVVDI